VLPVYIEKKERADASGTDRRADDSEAQVLTNDTKGERQLTDGRHGRVHHRHRFFRPSGEPRSR
jgi:hypothetical protein